MKRNLSTIVGVTTACLLTVSLAGCGNGSDIKKSDEPISASQAFNAEGVWFRSSDAPEKDEDISAVYVFDGAGNVTVYDTSLTYGELDGKSEDEIITIAKQQDEESFGNERDNRINKLNSGIRTLTDNTAEAQEGIDGLSEAREHYADDPDALAEIQQEEDSLQAEIDENNAEIQKAKDEIAELEAGYTAPEPQAFTLYIETDGTGNNAQSETLEFGDESFDFTTQSMGWTVYDLYFLGYDDLYTVVEQGHHGFVLDTPDTEGVEVD